MTICAHKKITNQLNANDYLIKPKKELKYFFVLFFGLFSMPIYAIDMFDKLTEFYKQEITQVKFLQSIMEYYHVNQAFPRQYFDYTLFSNEIDCKQRKHGFRKFESCNNAAHRLWGVTTHSWFCIERNSFDPLTEYRYECGTTDVTKSTAFQRWAIKKMSNFRIRLLDIAQKRSIGRSAEMVKRLEKEVKINKNQTRINEIEKLLKSDNLTIMQRFELMNTLKILNKQN